MDIKQLHSCFSECSGLTTDSRKIEEGCMFLALKGPSFDGNEYASDGLAQGAKYAVIDTPALKKDDRYLLVDDGLTALQDLAHYHRSQFEIPIIAITGSNGKTTTKELMNTVLSAHCLCHSTKGNLNNHIGVPLTLLQINRDHEIAVIEMGANHVGEIAALCKIAAPTYGIITNIGKAHLEGFGSVEGVKKAKSELYDYLANTDGVVFINKDEKYLIDLAELIKKKVLYGNSEELNMENPIYQTRLISTYPFVKLSFLNNKGEELILNSQLIGKYNYNNIITAITVGKYFKIPGDKIKSALESYQLKNMRSQLINLGTNTIILDAYNANPVSMKKALENLAEIHAEAKIAILGDMLELGEYSKNEHQVVLDTARQLHLDRLYLIGNEFAKFKLKANEHHFMTTDDLKAEISINNFDKTTILIKGSRSVGLEKLLPADQRKR